jgi:hypothetical protein
MTEGIGKRSPLNGIVIAVTVKRKKSCQRAADSFGKNNLPTEGSDEDGKSTTTFVFMVVTRPLSLETEFTMATQL